LHPNDFDWVEYVDDCEPNVFKSYVKCVKMVFQMTGSVQVGARPPSLKSREWFDEFISRQGLLSEGGD